MTQKNSSRAKKMVAYARLTVGWSRIEVPMGCYADRSPVFTHRTSELANPQWDYWVVGYTWLVTSSAVLVFFDEYGSYRIWRPWH